MSEDQPAILSDHRKSAPPTDPTLGSDDDGDASSGSTGVPPQSDDSSNGRIQTLAEAGETRPSPRPKHIEEPNDDNVRYAVGFWRRSGGWLVDCAIVAPVAALLTWVGGSMAGLSLPPSRHRGIDFWLDQLLANNAAFMGGIALTLIILFVYLFVFHTLMGHTPGMRAVRCTVIDVYGNRPTPARAAARVAGYVACLATLGLGFVWVGIDAEKRGLHDWIAGTYVVRS